MYKHKKEDSLRRVLFFIWHSAEMCGGYFVKKAESGGEGGRFVDNKDRIVYNASVLMWGNLHSTY